MQPEVKQYQTNFACLFSRTNANSSPAGTTNQPFFLNPYNLIVGITLGDNDFQRNGRKIYIRAIEYEYHMQAKAPTPNTAIPFSSVNQNGGNYISDYRLRQSIYTQKQTLVSIPNNAAWPFQTGLTYPYDASTDEGGLCGAMDPRYFKTYSDEIHILRADLNYARVVRYVKSVNMPYEYFANTDQTTQNNPEFWSEVPFMAVLVGQGGYPALAATYPFILRQFMRVFYTDI